MLKIKRLSICDIMACCVTFMALCRCFKFSEDITFFGIIALIVGFAILELFYKGKKLKLIWQDIFLLCFPFLILLNKHPDYPYMICFVYLIGWLAMYTLRCNIYSTRMVLYLILGFSIINMIVNWINMVSPNVYEKLITLLLIPNLSDDAISMYDNYGYLCGLSDHYSRNAYFLVSGIIVLLSFLLAKKKKKSKTILILVFVEFITLMMIGKRGHLIFLVLSFLIVYLLIEPSFWGKFSKTLNFFVIGAIGIALILYFIPQTGLALERMLEQANNGDISTGRYELWAGAWNMFLVKPIFGNGYGAFSVLTIDFAGVHNDYIQWLCEEGIVGFSIYLSATIGIYWISLKELKVLVTNSPEIGKLEQILIIWSVFFQTFMLTYSMTGLPHYDYEINTIYFLACAVPIGLLNIYKRQNIQKIKQFQNINFGD